MTARHVGRIVGWAFGCAVVVVVWWTLFGRRGAWLGVGVVLAATAWLVMWLPRTAHGAFEAARYRRASRRYRLIGGLAFTPRQERAARLSRAACEIAVGKPALADATLGAIDGSGLDAAEQVAWLNNRACVELDLERDPANALRLVEEASALRPDVPAVQHTRGRALLAVGRVDEAIAVLDAMRSAGELPAHLEAERCRDLASAWERKGQLDYAADYRDRARLHAG